MDERQLKGLCYNCDDKYFPGHKCKEQNLFMAISEDIQEDDDDTSPMPESPENSEINPPSDPPAEEPIISLNALTSFSAPQTLKLIGYIKHRKVIILVDSGSTHNFILFLVFELIISLLTANVSVLFHDMCLHKEDEMFFNICMGSSKWPILRCSQYGIS
jgi:hypothetical protein